MWYLIRSSSKENDDLPSLGYPPPNLTHACANLMPMPIRTACNDLERNMHVLVLCGMSDIGIH